MKTILRFLSTLLLTIYVNILDLSSRIRRLFVPDEDKYWPLSKEDIESITSPAPVPSSIEETLDDLTEVIKETERLAEEISEVEPFTPPPPPKQVITEEVRSYPLVEKPVEEVIQVEPVIVKEEIKVPVFPEPIHTSRISMRAAFGGPSSGTILGSDVVRTTYVSGCKTRISSSYILP